MITFLPEKIEYELNGEETILQAATSAGLRISADCAGTGVCGKCKVKVTGVDEPGFYLACCTKASDGMVIERALEINDVARKKKLVDLPAWFRPEQDESSQIPRYGISVDIGTTTVVVMLWNLSNGRMEGVKAVTNPQGNYGADVISRQTFAGAKSENRRIMQMLIVDAINEAAVELCKDNNIPVEYITRYVVVGNTIMSRLFRGEEPPVLAGADNADVYIGPGIAGHIGSDITAGLITTNIMEKKENHLFIDIGTNGEMVLTGNGKACACSTAAGPAFEGGAVAQGMRAAEGAIEKVQLSEEGVIIETISDAEPAGICGSGIIDAVAELVKIGIVDKGGRILDTGELRSRNVSEKLISHVSPNGPINDFVLYESPDGKRRVCITQKDIREVQLAKAAIEAGIKIMMKELGIVTENLDRVSVAGAFGSYIRTDSAVILGILPDVPKSKIYSLGNSAGIGASMMLLSENMMKAAETAVNDIMHIELADRSDFQEEYLMAMMF